MDIKGVKPVASRAKQTPFGAKTNTHLNRRVVSGPVQGAPAPMVNVQAAHPRSLLVAPAPARPQTARPMLRPAPVEKKDFGVPQYQAPDRPLKVVNKKRRKQTTRRKLVLRGAVASFVIVATIGGLLAWNGYVKLHKVFRGTSTVAALAAKPVAPGQLNGEGDGRVNILLLGIGGQGHDGPDLTDTIMLLSVDPVNHTAALLSIPRDLWVQQPIPYIAKQQKINAVYESGKYSYIGKMDSSNDNAAAIEAGFKNLDEVVEKVTGVNVNYHVLVDFQAFKQAIDTVGGVTVDVPTPLVDPTMAWENHNNPILAAAGVQHMDGTQALLYARSRETSSDFARSERQRSIIVALKDKVLTAGTLSNPTKIEALTNAFGDNVFSDMSTQGAERLYTIMKEVGDNNISSIGLTTPPHQLIKTGRVGNLSVDLPTAGLGDYTDIQNYVHSQLPDGYLVKERAPVTIVSHTVDGGAVTATLLRSYGYNVTNAITTDQPVPQLTLVDLSGGDDPYTLHYLQNRYHVTPVPQLPAGITIPAGSAKFVIIEP